QGRRGGARGCNGGGKGSGAHTENRGPRAGLAERKDSQPSAIGTGRKGRKVDRRAAPHSSARFIPSAARHAYGTAETADRTQRYRRLHDRGSNSFRGQAGWYAGRPSDRPGVADDSSAARTPDRVG